MWILNNEARALTSLLLKKIKNELDQVQEEVRTKENEKGQIQRNLLAESRQLTALRAEMDQLRDRFKSQEDSHVAAVADLRRVHQDEVNALKAELNNVQTGVPSGAEDTLSPSQQIAFQQVSGISWGFGLTDHLPLPSITILPKWEICVNVDFGEG